MRLVRVGVHGYKRFAEPVEMNVDGRVIAIVGPNEAGKTSFLQALTHLSRRGELAHSEWSRGQDRPTGSVVWARYLIEDDDREEMKTLPGYRQIRWYEVWKEADGSLYHRIKPSGVMERDLSPREKAVALLRKASKHKALLLSEEEQAAVVVQALSELADGLDVQDESLDVSILEQIDATVSALEKFELVSGAPKYIHDLPETLGRLRQMEELDPPSTLALQILDRRHPRFLIFSDADRDLRSDYDLVEVAEDPPAALRNIADLAGLNLASVRDAVTEGDYPRAEHLIEEANAQLSEGFGEAWRQSGVHLRLRTDETVLRVFVTAQGGRGYTDVAERSDGLRAFIALFAFAALRSGGRPPVLLIDEAENHLHYDAQADLVRVFSRQQASPKIIYTTHSAGCLPQDLAGVRLVVGGEDESVSVVRNAFWSEGPGLTPLLIGMGASVLAFATPRRAVFVEGGADLILLPTLLREALCMVELDFQVAPGLSEVHPEQIPGLDLQAAAVAYVVDGDAGGRTIRSKLLSGGVTSERIVVLGGDDSGFVLEDLVKDSIYAEAVNRELERSHGPDIKLKVNDLGEKDRPGSLRSWCKASGVGEPNKAAIAYRVLDQAAEGHSLVSDDGRDVLRSVYAALRPVLGIEK